MTATHTEPPEATPPLPQAEVRKRRGWSVFWLIPIAALGVAGWLIQRQFISTGMEIQITFQDASGLDPGKSPLEFRGVTVGRVREVNVSEDRSHAVVTATLETHYEDLAREGAQFWVVRPRISSEGIQGLGTLMSQNYIRLRLNPDIEFKSKRSFVGLAEAPATPDTQVVPEGLHVALLAPRRWALEDGSGIYYRGVRVGSVLSCQLGSDARLVQFDALIQKRFAPLVRLDSKFWKIGSIDVSAGLFSGVNVKVGDLQQLLKGGVAFATPPDGGRAADPDTAFRLYSAAKPEWLEWHPRIPLAGSNTNLTNTAEPEGRQE